MGGIAGSVASAVGLFAGTNVDDIIVLTVLFLSARASGSPRVWEIWGGQYAGFVLLVLGSVVAALGLAVVPDAWVGLLGVVPLGLGVKGLVAAVRARGDGSPVVASGLVAVAGVTVANGADNVSVYTPVFRAVGTASTVVMVCVFLVGVAVWCLAGSLLGAHKKVIEVVGRHGHWLVPTVFVVIGGLIVAESGVLGRIV
ncbi:cadmium resistance transporter [Actinomadura oligospora]|uniref:cadmium resistance transporter n=1 Tax=Actinomadura oligospora TaxID=111804 RepID=UPI001B80B083|nr:cadmium resistance transporter [Actinomadura oligospora]